MLSEKQMEFLKLCYEDGCIPSARWTRCRVSQPCVFESQKAQKQEKVRHNRSVFRAPFGCPHYALCIEGFTSRLLEVIRNVMHRFAKVLFTPPSPSFL